MEEEARLKLEVAHSIEVDVVCILFVRLDCTSTPERRLYDTGAIAFNSTLLHPPCSAGFVHPPGMLGRVSGIFCARSLLGGLLYFILPPRAPSMVHSRGPNPQKGWGGESRAPLLVCGDWGRRRRVCAIRLVEFQLRFQI